LLEKNIDFEHKIIDLKDKPTEFVAKYKEASGGYGSGLVPLLEHDDILVIESDIVAKYVAQNIEGIDGVGGKLYPESEEDVEQIQTFMKRWQHVTDTYYDLLTASSEKEVVKRKKEFIKSLAGIDNLLKARSGEFILGEPFSYAECISAPWIQRFYVTLPYFRGINFEDDILSRFDYMSSWMKAVCNRPSCVDSICPESEMIAACKRYYVSFLSPGAMGSY